MPKELFTGTPTVPREISTQGNLTPPTHWRTAIHTTPKGPEASLTEVIPKAKVPGKPSATQIQAQRAEAAKHSIAGFLDYLETETDRYPHDNIGLDLRKAQNFANSHGWIVDPKLKEEVDTHNNMMAQYQQSMTTLSGATPSGTGGMRSPTLAEFTGQALPDPTGDTKEVAKGKLEKIRQTIESRYGSLPVTTSRFVRTLHAKGYKDADINALLKKANPKEINPGALMDQTPSQNIDISVPGQGE